MQFVRLFNYVGDSAAALLLFVVVTAFVTLPIVAANQLWVN